MTPRSTPCMVSTSRPKIVVSSQSSSLAVALAAFRCLFHYSAITSCPSRRQYRSPSQRACRSRRFASASRPPTRRFARSSTVSNYIKKGSSGSGSCAKCLFHMSWRSRVARCRSAGFLCCLWLKMSRFLHDFPYSPAAFTLQTSHS